MSLNSLITLHKINQNLASVKKEKYKNSWPCGLEGAKVSWAPLLKLLGNPKSKSFMHSKLNILSYLDLKLITIISHLGSLHVWSESFDLLHVHGFLCGLFATGYLLFPSVTGMHNFSHAQVHCYEQLKTFISESLETKRLTLLIIPKCHEKHSQTFH